MKWTEKHQPLCEESTPSALPKWYVEAKAAGESKETIVAKLTQFSKEAFAYGRQKDPAAGFPEEPDPEWLEFTYDMYESIYDEHYNK